MSRFNSVEGNIHSSTVSSRIFVVMIVVSVFFTSLMQVVLAVEVVLLDSNDTVSANWTSVQHDGDSFPTDNHRTPLYAWAKLEDLSFNKLTQYFHVCSFRETVSRPQNNWLRSPVFNITDAVVLEVELEYLVSMCSDKSKYRHCAENVTMYYQFTDDGNENDPINGTNYQLIAHLPLDRSLLDRRQRLTVKINVTSPRKKGMVIAFRDTGGCSYIYRIIVRYTYCPSTTRNLIRFPRTVVGNNVVSVKGQCQANAILQKSSKLEMLCLTDGIWGTLLGSCICNAGYSFTSGVCKACATGSYKKSLGNVECLPCPLNSNSSNEGSTICACRESYSRLTYDVDENCTAPPGPPHDVTSEEKSSNFIIISWKRPKDDGGRSDLRYKILVKLGNGSLLVTKITNLKNYNFSNAKPDTYYEIQVMAFSGAGYGQHVMFSITTSALSSTLSSYVSTTLRPTKEGTSSKVSAIAIAGSVICGVLVVAALLAFFFFCYRKKHLKKHSQTRAVEHEDEEEHNLFLESGKKLSKNPENEEEDDKSKESEM